VTLGLIEESRRRESTLWRGDQAKTRAIGEAWLAHVEALSAFVYRSVIEPGENNLLINPAHNDFSRIQLTLERQPLRFDPRLFPCVGPRGSIAQLGYTLPPRCTSAVTSEHAARATGHADRPR